MAASSVAALGAWHDFYLMIGTAAATLIGAMFVVVSIGSGFLTPERAGDVRVFVTPTVIHLASVLFGCALTMVPGLNAFFFALGFGLLGAAGLGYSAYIARYVVRRELLKIDRLWYALTPLAGDVIVLAAAAAAAADRSFAVPMLGAGMAIILAAGIRNAWDMIVFLVARAGT